MLELRCVSKCYQREPAVQDVSLRIGEGETVAVIGPSGCGKSTLIRLMNGLLAPDSGTVYFRNRALRAESAPLLRRKMGYVVQDGGLFPHLTARGNITLMARHVGWRPGQLHERVADLAELTQFPRSGLDRYPAQLSGGQRQRVALMRALMLDPEVLLLDEPLGALDPMIRYELQADLKHVFRSLGKTVVLVTHDLAEASYFGNEIVLMREGCIEQQGPMAELLEAPATAFVERFIKAQRSLADALDNAMPARPPGK